MDTQNRTDFLQALNPEQLAAVTYPSNQSLLVLAGAGSGKTRVLTSRIIWLLTTAQSQAPNILAVTFTNKAAKEMRTRVAQTLPYSLDDMWLGTFHSLCHRLLRRYSEHARLQNNFQIIDTQDQLSILKRILKDSQETDTSITPKKLLYYINQNKEKGYRSDHPLLVNNAAPYYSLNPYYEIYEKLCQKEQLVDFTELLLRCVEMLQNNPLLQEALRNRFRHILIDEFQDTNDLQYTWLKLIKGEQSSVFVVGDDDQSIYSFRGANVKNMQYLLRDFKIDAPIKLEQNYRSTQIILDAANQLIVLNQGRIGKNLKSTQSQGELIKYLESPSDFAESQFIANEIQSLHNNGHDYSSIAVLYRSNAQSRSLEQSLSNANIPHQVYGGLRFYEREEIKHALAYLRLLVNSEDNHSFLRIINIPSRGIGSKSIISLQEISQLQQISLWEALVQEKAHNKHFAAFYQIIHGLRNKINTLSFPDLMQELIHTSGLIDYYQQQKGELHSKIDNLQELIYATVVFNREENTLLTENTIDNSPTDRIIAFLSNASLEAGERQSQTTQEKNDHVQLMTIHSSKGLEFNTVFLVGMEEGIFPSEHALNHIDRLEEERRLMYVATTRAKKKLYLSSVLERYHKGNSLITRQSRFIKELPQHLIYYLSLYHPGCMVRHASFGTGVIINQQQKAHSYLLTINFGKNGIKHLDSAFCHLEIIKQHE